MHRFVIPTILLSVVMGSSLEKIDSLCREKVSSLWDAYKEKFSKSYNSTEEDEERKEKFVNNLISIALHNFEHDLGIQSFRMGINDFTDMDEEEFSKTMTGLLPEESLNETSQESLNKTSQD